MLKDFTNALELDFTISSNKEAMLQAFAKIDVEKGQDYPLIIGGKKIYTEEKITSMAPATKEILGKVSSCDQELANEAILAAHDAFKTWSKVPVEERVCCVRRLVDLMDKNRCELNAWSVEESGKNWGEADGELCEALDFFNSYILHMQELDKGLDLVHSDEATKCMYIPIGVGVAVPPWNFPLSLLAGMAVSAVITGNTIVCKPSSDTPIVAYKFVELCEKAGFPAGVINFIPGSGSVIGDFIVKHPLTRFVNFTGSKEVGLRINKMAAEVAEGQRWIKRVVAEMGGKNAIIVDSTADLKRAAAGIANSAFSFQGQKCSACSRAIVMSDVYDEFVAEVVAFAEDMKNHQGSGRDNLPMGPVINKAAFENISSYIEVARKEGNIAFGGNYDDSKGFYIEPTVVRDITRDARIANEEIFGPVLAVIKVESFDEALDIANDTEYGLTGSVYTEDRNHIQKAKTDFHVGNLYFNRKSTGAVVLQHPFGGFNMSGTDAKTGTRDYLTNFLNLKSVCEDLTY